jgi:hypothetical protein
MTGRLWIAGAVAALAMYANGCVPNEVSFFIQQNQVPQPTGTTGCVVSADPEGLHRNEGLLDLAFSTRYLMHPLYRSELLSTQRRISGRAEMRGLFVDGADIELTPPGSTAAAFRYRVIVSEFVQPASTEGPGFGVGALEIIPDSVGAQLAAQLCVPDTSDVSDQCPVPIWPNNRQQLTAIIHPFGHTMGGVEVSGSSFVFPITFCCHCLAQFQSAAANPALTFPNCSASMGDATVACDLGQDDAIDCRSCALLDPARCQPRGFQNGTVACPL